MNLATVCAITSLTCTVTLTQATTQDSPKLWFMFFMKGDGPRPADRAELQKMQDGHIANMAVQYNKGLMLAAGPLQDPTQMRRGITICYDRVIPQANTLFKEDPFVKARIMTVVAWEWLAPKNRIGAPIDPDGIVPHKLYLFKRPLSRLGRRVLDSFCMGGSLKDSLYDSVWVIERDTHEVLEAFIRNLNSGEEMLLLYMSPGTIR